MGALHHRTARVAAKLRRERGAAPSPSHVDRGTDPGRPVAVLLCYACVPGAGSEEGVGWMWATAAAAVADVILITTPFAADAIRRLAPDHGLPIEVRAVKPQRLPLAMATRRWGGFVYYLVWQRTVAPRAAPLRVRPSHRRGAPRDVGDRLVAVGDLVVERPDPHLGPRGWRHENAPRPLPVPAAPPRSSRRSSATRSTGPSDGSAAIASRRRASLVVALNDDVADHFRGHGTPVVVEPNCALDLSSLAAESESPVARDGTHRTALFVARLMGWKGPLLAVEALVHAPEWQLLVLGEGTEREHMLEQAERLGVADRVSFRGKVPRSEVLAEFRTADALLFPSFHDSAPWAVGEASALGCPVVCLDAGGPPLLAGANGHIVPRLPAATLAQRLGEALNGIDGRGSPDDRWAADRLPGILNRWYRDGTHDNGFDAPKSDDVELDLGRSAS